MVDGILMLACGVLVALIGFRVIQFPSSPQFSFEAWHTKHGLKFRIMGILIAVAGAAVAVAGAVTK